MIRIESLKKETLEKAIDLVNKVFLEQGNETAEICFRASLNPEKYKNFLLRNQITELKYWIAIDLSGKVFGTTGLYCYQTDEREAHWLGWFCVDPALRKKGIGTRLLGFSISMARKRYKRLLRLYTSTDPNELDAHRLYERHGFKLM